MVTKTLLSANAIFTQADPLRSYHFNLVAVTVAVLVQSTGSRRPRIIPHLQNARGHHFETPPQRAMVATSSRARPLYG